MALRHMLGDEYPGARHLAADGRTLDTRMHSNSNGAQMPIDRIGRQQADSQCRHRHQKDAQHEHALAPEQVAEMRHDDSAQRTRQIASGKNTEGLRLTQPVRHGGREEQFRCAPAKNTKMTKS